MPTNTTPEQRARAIEIIRNDAQIQQVYIDPSTGETCAIGGLAKATGFDLGILLQTQSNSAKIGSHLMPHENALLNVRAAQMSNLAEHLEHHFGFNVHELTNIQQLNDLHQDRALRQNKIINYIERLGGKG